MRSTTEENYLKAIYKLSLKKTNEISTNEIALQVHTKAASVTDMLKRLATKKFISYEKYKGVKLTEKGKKVAIEIVRKHRLWEVFLVDKLKFKWDEVHDIAEQLEHINSRELINRIDDFLGRPKNDPHGDPIPDRNGKIHIDNFITLSQAKKGKYIIHGVLEDSHKFLQYLEKLKLLPGVKIFLLEVNEFDGSVLIKFGSKSIFMSKEAAKNILVNTLNSSRQIGVKIV